MVQTKNLDELFCEKLEMLDLAIQHNLYMIYSFSRYDPDKNSAEAASAIRRWEAENYIYRQHQELLWKLIAPLRCEYSQQ